MPVSTPGSLPRKRFHSFGVPHKDGFEYRLICKACNGRFIRFSEKLRHKLDRILICLDNAGCHKLVAVKKYIDDHRGDIVLKYLPHYTQD